MTKVVNIKDENFDFWIKQPNNLFAGSIPNIHENIFSDCEQDNDILFANKICNFVILRGKQIGYITPLQKRFADLLARMVNQECYPLINTYVTDLNLPLTYETTTYRMCLSRIIKEHLAPLIALPIGEQCLKKDKLLRNMSISKLLGSGSFGNVYHAKVNNIHDIALKMAVDSVTKAAIKHPYDLKFEAWKEINFLKPYLNSLVEKGICPNVPYTYESFICESCDFERTDKGKKIVKKKACYMIAMELFSGDLRQWASVAKRSDDDFQGALFQCMAGIHAIQKYFQMINNDIKALNILYKEIPKGGCWEYVIRGRSYYVPNNGFIFCINDFGVSSSKNPLLPICIGGFPDIRPFIIVNNKLQQVKYTGFENMNVYTKIINDIHYPYFSEKQKKEIKIILTPEQAKLVNKDDIYQYPEVLPYFDSYIDVQDTIKTFVSGKRTSQAGDHPKLCDINLDKYIIKINFAHRRIPDITKTVTPAMILAGYFIEDFFGNQGAFSRPSGKILQKYVI
jgi:serine/threonine protein kinase